MTKTYATRRACDEIVARAVEAMVTETEADIEMALDRLLTYAAAQAVLLEGRAPAVALFRHIADQIEAGALARIELHSNPMN
jgi:ribosomal protein L13